MSEREENIGPVTQERLLTMINYAVDLQRIIEDLCHDRDIRVPGTTARFHYDMAVKYRAALAAALGEEK